MEYDVSPVGPYREYVSMGGVVGLGKVDVGGSGGGDDGALPPAVVVERTLGIGQWGTDLYVSTQVAEDVCRVVWGVPAQVADIEFVEEGSVLADGPDDNEKESNRKKKKKFTLSGWGNARVLNNGSEGEDESAAAKRYGNIPILWTPTIKALWAPFLFPGGSGLTRTTETGSLLLPLHKLRLSASALRIKRCERIRTETTAADEIPLGLALVVDNVLIEIGERVTSGK